MYTTRSNILRIVLVISVCCVITARSEMGETHGFNEEFSYLRSNRENNKDSILILGGLDSGMPPEEFVMPNVTSDLLSLWDNSTGNGSSDGAGPSSDEYVPYSLRPETYIIPVLFAIIFIIGMAGNGTLIIIFLKHRTMRNVPNMYIVSLAVGDLLVILFCVPFTSTVYTVESWPYGELVCKFSEFIKDVSIGVSVFTLTALSADRYFAIVDPMRKLQGRRATRITCISIVGIWIISIVFAVPSMLNSFIWRIEDKSNNHTYEVCYPFPSELGPTYPKVVVMFKFLVYYAIPLAFIATFYVIMAHHLLLSTRNMPGEAQGQAKQIQARKKVAKMVMAFVVIFAMCFFPSHVFLIWFYYNPSSMEDFNDFWHVVRMVGFCLSFINSCLNPITLYIVSGTFRKHFNRHLFCCCCPQDVRGRGARGGYNYSQTHTEHICHDRISRNGTQISRASTVVVAGGTPGRRSIAAGLNGQQPPPSHWLHHNESHLKPLLTTTGGGRESILTGGGGGSKISQKSGGGGGEDFPLNHLSMNVSSINVETRGGGEAITVGM
ncbi:neuropeptide CCHamide-1 receptor isoform X2 [Folsomia candida]|uniref:neuropeptide CCHamide-1 receptor isoform X2 n=1 Tax=Folsomia candida TaxID=158441 RepID=UPI000B8F965D|nr:neuropeptide CCHamide-1 receptor isoform X2 [Folsomia candida]